MARNLRLQVMLNAVDRVTGPLKRMRQGAGQTGQAMRDTRDQLKELQRTQSDLTSYRKANAAQRQNTRAMRDARARNQQYTQALEQQREAHANVKSGLTVARREYGRLAKELLRTKQPSDQLTSSLERARVRLHGQQSEFDRSARAMKEYRNRVRHAGEEVKRLTQNHATQTERIRGLKTRLDEAGISTDNLGQSARELRTKEQRLNAELQEQQRHLADVAKRQRQLTEARERYQRTVSRGQRITGAGAMGTAVGSAGVVAMGTQAIINQSSGARLAAQQGEGGEEAARYREVITKVYTTGRGQGLEQVTEAVSVLASQFESLGVTSNEQLQAITQQALTLTDTFNIDLAEAAQTAGIMVQNGLATNATEAFDLMARGMQEVSASMRHELPEILHEYGTNFRALGFDGKESLNMLVAAAEQGRFALDKTGDALKEFTIRGSDMSKASVDAYDAIGLNAQEMADAIAGGGDRAGAALTTTAQRLLDIESPAEMANAAIALFGTPLEDLSVDQIPAFLRALAQSNDRIGEFSGITREMGETLDNNAGDALKRVQRAIGGAFMGVLEELDDTIIRVSNNVTAWMQANPELTSTLTKAAIGLAALTAAGGTVLVMLGSIIGPLALMRLGASMLGIKVGGLGQALGWLAKTAIPWVAGALKGLLVAMGPIGWGIAAIAATALVIYKYWEPIKAFFVGLWQQVKAAFDEGVGGVARLLLNWSPYGLLYNAFTSTIERLGITIPNGFRDFGSMIVDGIINGISAKLGELRDSITGMASNAMGWFRDVLDINSPSRVFTQYGGFITEGLANGIEDDADSPIKQVRGIANHLRNAAGGLMLGAGLATNASAANIDTSGIQIDARPPLQSHASAAPSGGLVIHGGINIQVHAAPGMDEQALARMVNEQVQRALQDAERRAAAASRRNFHDND